MNLTIFKMTPFDHECISNTVIVSISKDIDECQDGDNECHSNADCLNSIGSYSCQCKPGYQGSGFICKCKCCVMFTCS